MVDRISSMLTKKQTIMRDPLSVGWKLVVSLRFLASVDSNKCPKTSEEWKTVAEVFTNKWNYHNFVGALDRKHVPIKKTKKGGSLYHNYKKFPNIIIMAVVDAKYKFMYVDVGAEGGAVDGGTWSKCIHHAIEQKRVGFPEDSTLPNDDIPIPIHIISEYDFALKTRLMKLYSPTSQAHHEKIYSYRVSHARGVVKNTFSSLKRRLRIFGTSIQQEPKVLQQITTCGCILHNLIPDHYPFAPNDVDHKDTLNTTCYVELGGRNRMSWDN
ncbi:uncharacterized protein [Palaemon carinicauda]|uniref:uncharacterized protein n=1 Tax=Palaemon carinicauda TaxID=392227 RepID=UPI0035B5FEE3